MIVNNLGTIIYSFFYGKKVGIDNFGNKYFVSKKNPKKKWVLYKQKKDPTIIPVNWQIWLTAYHENLEVPSDEKTEKHIWEKERKQNLTGTINSYYPTEKISGKKNNINKKYSTWEPN
mgnify:CR=1 FL=1